MLNQRCFWTVTNRYGFGKKCKIRYMQLFCFSQLSKLSLMSLRNNSIYSKFVRDFYMKFYFGWNEIFWARCLVSILQLFTHNTQKLNTLEMLFHCSHFDRNKISFWVTKSLRENCSYSEFFWSVFSHIRTEYP